MAAITSPKTTKTASREDVYSKAQRIISDPSRVSTLHAQGTDFWGGIVTGDHGRYGVVAISEAYMAEHGIDGARIGCVCRAARRGVLCSHAIVAEEMRLRGELR